MAYLFFTLTSFHLYSRLLMTLHLELCLLIVILATAAVSLVGFRSAELRSRDRILAVLCLALIGSPLLTSLVNGQLLDVTSNAEYLSWVKMLIVSPVVFLFLSGGKRETLLNLVIAALGGLAIVFWYRFGWLGEIREFDLRPKLQVKNGDPNFLCVLFATAVPLVLLRIQRHLSPLHRRWLLADGLLLALFLSVVIATESRMGILSLVVGLSVLVLTIPQFRKVGLLIGLGVAVWLASYGGIVERFVDISDVSNQMRLKSMWSGAVLFSSRPLFGHGWDSAPASFFSNAGYPRLLSETFPLQVHNTPLQLLAELGIYGFIAYAALLVFTWSTVRRAEPTRSPFFLAALLTLGLNFLTLPLQNKDFVLCLIVCLAAASRRTSELPFSKPS